MKIYSHFILAIVLSFAWACQKTKPSSVQTPIQEIPSLISPYAENYIGSILLKHTLDQYSLWYDENVSAFVTEVGSHVSIFSMRKNVLYQFYVLESKKLFSFGLPAGHIFISTALLKEMKTEAELASILASEIAHIEHQDLIRLMFDENEQKLVSNFQDPKTIEKAWDVIHTKRYPDDVENKADRLGLYYAAHFGYEPEGYTALLNRVLQKQENRMEEPEVGDLDLNFLYHRASIGVVYTEQVQKHNFAKRKITERFDEIMKSLPK